MAPTERTVPPALPVLTERMAHPELMARMALPEPMGLTEHRELTVPTAWPAGTWTATAWVTPRRTRT